MNNQCTCELCKFLPPSTETFFMDMVECYDIKTKEIVLVPFNDVLKGLPVGLIVKTDVYSARKTLPIKKSVMDKIML